MALLLAEVAGLRFVALKQCVNKLRIHRRQINRKHQNPRAANPFTGGSQPFEGALPRKRRSVNALTAPWAKPPTLAIGEEDLFGKGLQACDSAFQLGGATGR